MPAKKQAPNPQPTREDYLSDIINALDVAVFVFVPDTALVTNCNSKLAADILRPKEDICGKDYHDVFWPEISAQFDEMLAQANFDTATTRIYYWAQRMLWGQLALRKVLDHDGREMAVVSITNITAIGRSEYEHRRMAYFDPDLDIPNGRQLEQDVAALGSYHDVALIHFDIYQFSTVNDVYGWDTGDYVLQQVRDWMLSTAVEGCKLYRAGEDEFAMLIRGISLDAAKSRARQVLRRFAQGWDVSPQSSLQVYVTIGMVVVYGEYVGGDIRNQLFRTSSRANSAEGFTLYDAEMDAKLKQRLLLRQTLVNCVQQGMLGFSVVYQPIVDPYSGAWRGVEALCRWHNEAFGNVPPLTFISDLEHLGLIDQLDNWVMETAVANCTAWGLGKKEQFMLDINLSPVQVMDNGFAQRTQAMLDSYGYPYDKLCLEVTESHKFDFTGENLLWLERMRDAGFSVALDDFGTGYSSLENLIRLPARYLKTEKSFIDKLETDSYQQYLLRMMMDLAHTANMRVVSEGVETEGQRNLLASYGVDFIQGYYYSRPLDAKQMRQNLHKFE